ncbi:MAG: A/G-specific adenine glycosylase [Egibacteraceae bacterium]
MSGPPPSGSVKKAILDWYAAGGRQLGWRRTEDPYAILVSEVMLQQTQATRVEPVWRAFLERFPTVAALALAPLADVLTAWRGLGYNRRAVNLHRCAVTLCDRHSATVPDDLAALRALPGIGDYTARAVLVFAFGRSMAPVDTNVARVLARLVTGRPLSRSEAQRVADAAVPAGHALAWTHALMDLGAQVCTARSPRCDECPVWAGCAWRVRGGRDPAPHGEHRPRPQGRFAGSDRFHRGRLVDALRAGPVPRAQLASACSAHGSPQKAERIAAALVADGLAEWAGEELRLPH